MSTRAQAWQERVQIARQAGRLGDLLVLVEEAPPGARRAEALIEAGEELRKAERFDFALEYLDRALEIEPGNLQGLREKDICLRRLALARPAGHSPDRMTQPGQVLLFSGHIIDAPDRQPPRFPNFKAPIAGERIAAALDELGAGPEDLSFSQASAGGDLLFLESCQQRGVRCRILLPFPEPEFIDRSIAPSADGDRWRARYHAMKARLPEPVRVMPDELGPAPDTVSPYERCNLWLLCSALALGAEKLRFVCLWNGGGEEGPGGTAHMYREVKRRTARVTWIDTRSL
jgi:tetratricopeptide (TPR) repeat protein